MDIDGVTMKNEKNHLPKKKFVVVQETYEQAEGKDNLMYTVLECSYFGEFLYRWLDGVYRYKSVSKTSSYKFSKILALDRYGWRLAPTKFHDSSTLPRFIDKNLKISHFFQFPPSPLPLHYKFHFATSTPHSPWKRRFRQILFTYRPLPG